LARSPVSLPDSRHIPASVPASGGGGGGSVAQRPAVQSPESQTLPQPPQLFTSIVTSVQPLPQAMSPAGHVHIPPLETEAQVSPLLLKGHVPHARPPAPHDATVCDAKSSHVEPLQQPDKHEAVVHWQMPETHCCMPPHAMLHEPQCAGSVLVLTHTPGEGVPQSVGVPAGHMQAPMVQLASSGHWRPQLPQLLLSLSRFASQPFAGLPSQFP
jgi:hypothetical protein